MFVQYFWLVLSQARRLAGLKARGCLLCNFFLHQPDKKWEEWTVVEREKMSKVKHGKKGLLLRNYEHLSLLSVTWQSLQKIVVLIMSSRWCCCALVQLCTKNPHKRVFSAENWVFMWTYVWLSKFFCVFHYSHSRKKKFHEKNVSSSKWS